MLVTALGRAARSAVRALSEPVITKVEAQAVDRYQPSLISRPNDPKLTINARDLAASVDLDALRPERTGVRRLTIVNDADLVMGGVAGNVDVISDVAGKLGYEVLVLGPHNVGSEAAPLSRIVEANFAKNARIPYDVTGSMRTLNESIGGFGRTLIMTERNFGRGARDFFVKARIPFASAYCSKYETMAEERVGAHLTTAGWPSGLSRTASAYVKRFISHELVDLHLAAAQTITPQPVVEHLFKMGVPLAKITPWTHDVNRDDFSPSKRSNWDALGVPDVKGPVLLSASRISLEKNIPLLARLKDWPGTIIVMGDGPLLEQYRAEMPYVRFIGRRSGDDLFAAYATADFFMQTSSAETFGRTTLEALASGCTVLGLDTPQNRFVCGGSEAAFLGDDLTAIAAKARAARSENRDAQVTAAVQQSSYFTREATAGIAIRAMLEAGGPKTTPQPTLTGRDYDRAIARLRSDDLRTIYPEGYGQPPTTIDSSGRMTRDHQKLLELRGLA